MASETGSSSEKLSNTQKLSNKEKQRLRAERAAAALEERRRRERRRQLLTVAAVVVAIAALVAGGFVVSSLRDNSQKVSASAPPAGSDYGLTVGPDSAPHKVVVYEDFLCPICGEFEKAGHVQLADLAKQGKVQIEYRPFVLLARAGPYSERAAATWAMVLQNDGPEVAKAYHDLLFANQPSETGPFPSSQDLIDLAGQAGADVDALKASLDAGDGDAWAKGATEAAVAAGVNSTPTALLDGQLFTDFRTPDDLAANLVKAVQ